MKSLSIPVVVALALPLLAQAQDLPSAWPGRPYGTAVHLAPAAAYGGAALAWGDDHQLVAWCDMRDGRARLMLQAFPLDHPAAGGAWSTEVEGLGTVQALVHGPSPVTPFMPSLASDHQGGAYVLWHDLVQEGWGELRLQRVGDDGTFLWEEDLVVAPAVPTPEEGCREGGDRCRSETDNLRGMVSDGQGVWVIWKDLAYQRFALRVTPEGGIAPGFPPAGQPLGLQGQGHGFHSLGTSLLHVWWEDGPPTGRGMAQGLRDDAGLLFPAGDLRLTPADGSAEAFQLERAGDGLWLAAWLSGSELRAQLFDDAFHAQWNSGGQVVAANARSLLLPGGLDSGPPWHVVFLRDNDWLAQRLDGAGTPLWAMPAALGVGAQAGSGYLTGASQDEQGLVYHTVEDNGRFLQRLAPDGTQRWAEAVARLDVTPIGSTIDTHPDGTLSYRERSSAWNHVLLHRRDLDGNELLTPDQGRMVDVGPGPGSSSTGPMLATDDALWVPWVMDNQVYLQAVDTRSGNPGWGMLDRPLGLHQDWQAPPLVSTGDGFWLGTADFLPDNFRTHLHVQRMDLQGQSVLPPVEVFPALADTMEMFNWQLLPWGDDVVVAAHVYITSDSQIRLQRLDRQGTRLWGDAGVQLPTGGLQVFLHFGLLAGDERVGVVWSTYGATPSLLLQQLDGNGAPQIADNGGLGRSLPLTIAAWPYVRYAPLSDGGLLVRSRVNDGSMTTQTEHHLRLDANGNVLSSASFTHSLEFGTPALDGQNRLWLARLFRVDGLDSLEVVCLDDAGALHGRWTHPGTGTYFVASAFTWTDSQRALVVAFENASWDHLGAELLALRLDEEGCETLLDMPLGEVPLLTWVTGLQPAPDGDVFMQWRDSRGDAMNYGNQSRLVRLDILEGGTPVAPPARPGRLELVSIHPNPFNPTTWVELDLPQAGPLTLDVHDLAGRRVSRWSVEMAPAGPFRHRVDLQGMASGMYIVSAVHPAGSVQGKLLLVK